MKNLAQHERTISSTLSLFRACYVFKTTTKIETITIGFKSQHGELYGRKVRRTYVLVRLLNYDVMVAYVEQVNRGTFD